MKMTLGEVKDGDKAHYGDKCIAELDGWIMKLLMMIWMGGGWEQEQGF